jgi:glycosyltransferase involved in cell wall biosynthesis
MSQKQSLFSSASRILAKLFLRFLGKPLTYVIGLLQSNLQLGSRANTSVVFSPIFYSGRLLNWFVQGAITISQPEMHYNPFTWRKKRKASRWASQITGIKEEILDSQARHYLHSQQSRSPSATSSDIATFTVYVGFHTHLKYLNECVTSIAKAASNAPETFLQLLLINDDPSVDNSLLEKVVAGTQLQSLIFSNKINLGICRSINSTLAQAQGDWIIHLDCDDRLSPDAIVVLRKFISLHPGVRFISSRSVDIDEDGSILAYRLREQTPVDLIENNYASHLKAIRKDLHEDIGNFDPLFEGCQDFEFALRTALFEQILFIPDYLYQYRWHDSSQTVGNCDHQNEVMIRVRQTYLLAIEWILNGPKEILIHPTGNHAKEWSKKILGSPGNSRWIIDLETESPFSDRLYKILLITISGMIISSVSKGETRSAFSIRI